MDTESTESKFKLDGDIETPKESKYVADLQTIMIRRLKLLLIGLGVALLISIAFIIWQSSTMNESSEPNLATSTADSTNLGFHSQDSMQRQIDSLNEQLLILQSENELLIENSDKTDGIFFEVLIGGFEDFNVDRYVSDLAKAKRRKYEGTDRMVVARFRSFKKALLFENDLKRIGIKNVAIAGSVNGQVVSFKEALEVSQQKK